MGPMAAPAPSPTPEGLGQVDNPLTRPVPVQWATNSRLPGAGVRGLRPPGALQHAQARESPWAEAPASAGLGWGLGSWPERRSQDTRREDLPSGLSRGGMRSDGEHQGGRAGPYRAGGHAAGTRANHHIRDPAAPELHAVGVGQEGQGRLLQLVGGLVGWRDTAGPEGSGPLLPPRPPGQCHTQPLASSQEGSRAWRWGMAVRGATLAGASVLLCKVVFKDRVLKLIFLFLFF